MGGTHAFVSKKEVFDGGGRWHRIDRTKDTLRNTCSVGVEHLVFSAADSLSSLSLLVRRAPYVHLRHAHARRRPVKMQREQAFAFFAAWFASMARDSNVLIHRPGSAQPVHLGAENKGHTRTTPRPAWPPCTKKPGLEHRQVPPSCVFSGRSLCTSARVRAAGQDILIFLQR